MPDSTPVIVGDDVPPANPPVATSDAGVGNTFESLSISDQWDTSAQIVIRTTESEMRNILHKHMEALTAHDAWVPPLTAVIPIAVALVAGVESRNAETALLIGLGAALLWFGAKAKDAFKHRGHSGIDAIIDELCPAPKPPETAARAGGLLKRLLLRRST